MRRVRYLVLTLTGVLCLLNVVLGCLEMHWLPVTAGVLGLGFLSTRRPSQVAQRRPNPLLCGRVRRPTLPAMADAGSLVEEMIAQRRYALLLRRQIASTLDETQWAAAREALAKAMSLVPGGEVVLEWGGEPREEDVETEPTFSARRVMHVEPVFLDRYPVTNQDFAEFVEAGGYSELALWEETIWPAVLDFVDRSGLPGPRFWRDGCYLPGEDTHPVVGVCWYEACAYARWVGKRLPTDAEWVKAGSWPVVLPDSGRVQRRYPWGDAMDRNRANLWGSGPGRTTPVEEFSLGGNVGGIHQLIGNVWEWTANCFRACDRWGVELLLPSPMKSLRGGAFDTYFDAQATCQFASGDSPLARKPNIGFRCAIGLCDVTLEFTAAAERRTTDPADEVKGKESAS